EVVHSKVGGEMILIGTASHKQLQREPFGKVYPEWSGKSVLLNLDVGLIQIDDLTRWTAQVFGVGMIGPLADLGTDNFSLGLIDAPVTGYGCATGLMKGAIKALFYRYNSIGGFEYVSDFLIGARGPRDQFSTHPGDSGTLWLLETAIGPCPIALQWG